MAGLRFRAENSHRLPHDTTGWYLYHKSKNYHIMFGGVKEGIKMAAKLGFWVGAFFAIEEAVDQWGNRWEWRRGKRDALSTTIAGLSVAGVFSIWSWLNLILLHNLAGG
jgi:hypothetical protein